MNVAGLFSAETEIDPAKPMDTRLHAGPSADVRFDFAHRAKTRRTKKARRTEQHGIENLRCAGKDCEPFQSPNGEIENQELALYWIFESRRPGSSPIFTRSCFIESRSRSVTVSRNAGSFSPSVSKSTVMPNGVPASSCRRYRRPIAPVSS